MEMLAFLRALEELGGWTDDGDPLLDKGAGCSDAMGGGFVTAGGGWSAHISLTERGRRLLALNAGRSGLQQVLAIPTWPERLWQRLIAIR